MGTGQIIAGLFGGAALGITAVAIPFVSPGFRRICLPYIPATPTQISNVLTSVDRNKLQGPMIDLGSGDGRIVTALHNSGVEAHGLELNYWLILYSRLNALTLPRSTVTRPRFIRADLWKHDLSPYATVVIFGTESLMELIAKKASEEMRVHSHLIACRFPFPADETRWSLKDTVGDGIDAAWTYRKLS